MTGLGKTIKGVLDRTVENLLYKNAVLILNNQGRIEHANEAWENLYKQKLSDVLGKFPDVIIPKKDHDEVAQLLGEIAATRKPKKFPAIRHGKDGRLIFVDIKISPRFNANTFKGFTVTSRENISAEGSSYRDQLFDSYIERFHLEKTNLGNLVISGLRDLRNLKAYQKKSPTFKYARNFKDNNVYDKYFRCDTYLMERALFEILRYSVKESRTDGEIGVFINEDNDGDIVITVTHQGSPVPEEGDIFAESQTREKGFGLYFCKRVIEAHKGKIDAYNIPAPHPSGTVVFKIYLPKAAV